MDKDELLKIIGRQTVLTTQLQEAVGGLVTERDGLRKSLVEAEAKIKSQELEIMRLKHPIGPQEVGGEGADNASDSAGTESHKS